MTRQAMVAVALALICRANPACASDLGDALLKTVAVGAVVTAISEPADDAINTLMMNRELPQGVETKVVPVLSVKASTGFSPGTGGRAGWVGGEARYGLCRIPSLAACRVGLPSSAFSTSLGNK